MHHAGLYVMLGLLILSAFVFGFWVTQQHRSSTALVVGYSMFFGAGLITGVYELSAQEFYPGQTAVFAAMDKFIFRIAALMLVAWIVGMFSADFVKSRQAHESKRQCR
jgi:hypothetical protein